MRNATEGIVLVAGMLQENLQKELASARRAGRAADEAIGVAESLLAGTALNPAASESSRARRSDHEGAWDEEYGLTPMFSDADVLKIRRRVDRWREECLATHTLDATDCWVAGIAGTFAGLVDLLLVRVPFHPGFLGAPGDAGGWLSNCVNRTVSHILTPERIGALEHMYRVPYDVPWSPAAGFGPSEHRLHSLGHDPILGFIIGVRDVLRDTCTVIGRNGEVRTLPGASTDGLAGGLLEASIRVLAHLVSDLGTVRGLPPPFAALFLKCQFGSFVQHGYSTADIARAMYRSGYDLRHFAAGGIAVLVTETIVRLVWTIRRLGEGTTLRQAVPLANIPRLRKQLLFGHAVATAINAGKLTLTQNPLSINVGQWYTLCRYLMPQLQWLLVNKHDIVAAYADQKLTENWGEISSQLEATWARCMSSR